MSQQYLTVTALTKYVKHKLEGDSNLQNIMIKGEISNFNHHYRGHMYLTIKDETTKISAVMFNGYNRYLKFTPENGMKVLIKGEVGVYVPHGRYQLHIQSMEPDGIGSLHLAFRQLKETLEKKGYFKQEFKKEIPYYPKKIAVITSQTGAAIRDILITLKRRYPLVETLILPSLVQGEYAARSISERIYQANTFKDIDVIISGRGGGSIEDLWPFNEKIVAEAIYHSDIPIISAVGHETDFTISDFVADKRAATPTAAAELAVPSKKDLQQSIRQQTNMLTQLMESRINRLKKHHDYLHQNYAFRYPLQLVKQKEQELDRKIEQMTKQSWQLLKINKQYIDQLNIRYKKNHPKEQLKRVKKGFEKQHLDINKKIYHILNNKQKRFNHTLHKLSLLNPLEIMKRGYAVPYTSNQKLIYSINDVDLDDKMVLRMSDGRLYCDITDIERGKIDE